MKSALKVAGFNFEKLEDPEDLKISSFKDVNVKDRRNFIVSSGPFYEIIIYNNLMEFEVKSSILPSVDNSQKYGTSIKQVICEDDNCYFLHSDGKISQYNVKSKILAPINTNEQITQISATTNALYGISSANCLFEILPKSNLIHKFDKHQQVKKMASGLEHTLILTKNGDVFSFGCCLRGQIGHGTMSFDEPVKLIEALGGIKIIDIACSGFSSIVVSSFGDVYSFGWNTNGQLGIKKATDRCKQVYTLPEAVDISVENVSAVFCGYKHTILRTENNKVFVCGLNNYGQLGIDNDQNEIDEFREIKVGGIIDNKTVLCCGYWTTYIINFMED